MLVSTTLNGRSAEPPKIRREISMLQSRTGAGKRTTREGPRMTAEGPMRGTRGSERIDERLRKSSASGTRRSTGARWRDCTSSRSGSSVSMSKNSEKRERSKMLSARRRKSMGNASKMRPRGSRSIARSLSTRKRSMSWLYLSLIVLMRSLTLFSHGRATRRVQTLKILSLISTRTTQ